MISQKDISEKCLKILMKWKKCLMIIYSSPKLNQRKIYFNKSCWFIWRKKRNKQQILNWTCKKNRINGRSSAIKRCFVNIIQNGLTYGEKVYVNIQKTPNRLIILFKDNGPGIPIEQYKNVFKPLDLIKAEILISLELDLV